MSNFAYMSGTGNDFLVGEYDGPVSDIQIIALVSDSEFDVDGVIFVEQIDKLTVKMHYFNNDGSQAELCVNGVRCVAKYSLDNQFVTNNEFVVIAPVSDIKVSVNDNIVELLAPIPEYNEKHIEISNHKGIVSTVGNPHFMVEVNNVENFELEDLYQLVNNNENFKNLSIIEKKLKNKEDLFNRNYKYKTIKIDNTYPNFILENKENLKDYIYAN